MQQDCTAICIFANTDIKYNFQCNQDTTGKQLLDMLVEKWNTIDQKIPSYDQIIKIRLFLSGKEIKPEDQIFSSKTEVSVHVQFVRNEIQKPYAEVKTNKEEDNCCSIYQTLLLTFSVFYQDLYKYTQWSIFSSARFVL